MSEATRVPPGMHRIRAVARATGVTSHALRIWERRYGVIASHRSPKNYRLYTDDDVARIVLLRELTERGYSIGDVAALSMRKLGELRTAADSAQGHEEARAMLQALPRPDARLARTTFLASIESFDLDAATRVLDAARKVFSIDKLLTQVVAPVLVESGDRWRDGALDVAHEHVSSTLLRGQLESMLREARPRPRAPVIVATTPEDELHELGALIAALIAASAGARIVYLGPATPASDLAAAAERSSASAVMLSSVALRPRVLRTRFAEVRRALPGEVELWVGGAAVVEAPSAAITWVRSLTMLRRHVVKLSKRRT